MPKTSDAASENLKAEKLVVGWREWITLPQLKVESIKVKVDTGATTSALHAEDLEYFKSQGRRMVRFCIFPLQRSNEKRITAVAEVFDQRLVRSSNGKAELRPVIITDVEILGQRWPIELTLANRDMMGFRMLLGREALRGRFVVDPEKSFKGRQKPKISKRKKTKANLGSLRRRS